MHGAGNDYVYIDATKASDTTPANEELPSLAKKISDRHFGIGGDGLVVILPSEVADFRMRMFNADGSEAQMCGNASRCVGKLVYDSGLTRKQTVSLETLAGIKILHIHTGDDNKVHSVTVDMGLPELEAEKIPVVPSLISPATGEFPPKRVFPKGFFPKELIPKELLCKEFPPTGFSMVEMAYGEEKYRAVAVSMGNPHAVIFLEETPSDRHVLQIGPTFEVHPAWPEKTNVEFAHVVDRRNVEMRVWERGTGETLACGTGACATAVAGMLLGVIDREADIHLTGGTLHIRWDEATNHVFMTGPAVTVATGTFFNNAQCIMHNS